ncbi:MAG TPA: MarR family winged helix-turn-helix transcriptional regulator [Streptosporangiaceae bacterium]|nr:MarR family winged helix-turn-helix transcriptional regulator [Streptosporangiaceae bacterium]
MPAGLSDALGSRLGYLLKHAQQRLVQAAGPVMAQFGIDGRELAVLTVLAADYPLSQHQAAERLGVDRTTMVALVDELEGKGLVERHRSLEDRRKNIVQLTDAGQHCLDRAGRARDEVEREFLAPLGDKLGQQFVRALQILVGVPHE